MATRRVRKKTRKQQTDELTAKFVSILGSNNVYYEPPENVHMQYPCIVYTREHINSTRADNAPYSIFTQYKVTHIGYAPDSEVLDSILASFKRVRHASHFVADGLHQDVFYIYV